MEIVPIRGRGAFRNPPNRFEEIEVARDEWCEPPDPERGAPRTRYFRDDARSVIARNDSPDVGFDASLNPYRGCSHGCVYCYARPGHEFLGLSAGLDFESRIFVKEDAPELLRRELASPRWRPQVLVMCGVTDPYQPAERHFRLTRRCLGVLAEFRNPVALITKSHLVTRDVDLLSELAGRGAARVTLSITTLDPGLRRLMEPRTSSPGRRLAAVRSLSDAGVPVGVNVAPVIPGLTEHELPRILEAAAEAGATTASYLMLRLPGAVKDLFRDWLVVHFPGRADKVLGRIRQMRGGRLDDPRFGSRMRGSGALAEQVSDLFRVTCRRVGLERDTPPLSTSAFRRPAAPGGQRELFPEAP